MKSWHVPPASANSTPQSENLSHFAAASFVVFLLKEVWNSARGKPPQDEPHQSVRILNEP